MNSHLNGNYIEDEYNKTFRKTTEISRPSSLYVCIDEWDVTINDGMFAIKAMAPNSGRIILHDFPGMYHGLASGLSFADGHAETRRWKGLVLPASTYDVDAGMQLSSAQKADGLWLMSISTTKANGTSILDK